MRLVAPALLALILSGCAGAPDAPLGDACAAPPLAPDPAWAAQAPRVRLATSRGAMVAELELERAPVTAGNFLDLARARFYDDTTFHRVVRGFAIQGGAPAGDPGGGPGYAIPDELHPALRHDAAGVLSMATSGPDTGGSQFFVTLAAAPHLDDRHSVFGRVVEGLDVARAIGEAETDAQDRPVEPIALTSVEILEPRAYEAAHAVDARVVIPAKRAEPGRPVTFAIVLQNEGTTRDRLALRVDAPEGWGCAVDAPVVVAAGASRVALLTLTPPARAGGAHAVGVAALSSWPGVEDAAPSVLRVEVGALGEALRAGDTVQADYAGMLPDGRLFDTTFAAIAQDPAQPKLESRGGWQPQPSYAPFEFTAAQVVPGFAALVADAKVGEVVAGRLAARDAYATGNAYENPLVGRDLVFEVEILARR